LKTAIELATAATNIASSEAKVPPGYMASKASLDEVLKEIGDAIQIIKAHPALPRFGDVKVEKKGENIYAFVCSSADSHILYPPSESTTEKGSPISQLLKKLTDLRNNVIALRSKRPLTPEEEAKISAISL
jgi:CTP synthase (UTP-ammonia lyase)